MTTLATTVMSISTSDDPPTQWENLFHESQFHTEFDEHEQVSLHGEKKQKSYIV